MIILRSARGHGVTQCFINHSGDVLDGPLLATVPLGGHEAGECAKQGRGHRVPPPPGQPQLEVEQPAEDEDEYVAEAVEGEEAEAQQEDGLRHAGWRPYGQTTVQQLAHVLDILDHSAILRLPASSLGSFSALRKVVAWGPGPRLMM